LLDDTLQASAHVLVGLLASNADALLLDETRRDLSQGKPALTERFAWQLVGPGPKVLLRSPHAPTSPLHETPTPGFTDTPQWRVYGTSFGSEARMLYVAQTRAERREAVLEFAAGAALSALAVGLLGHLWLRARVRHELAPLLALSDRLAAHDPLQPGATLGVAEREELQPVHSAIDDLGQRLARRAAHERAFSAHAAHSLRTPLAGIDAQLAVALRESPPALQPRLQRVREAAARLQRVIAALLALFRSSVELKREPVDLPALLALLPVEGLSVDVQASSTVNADADLLAAALLNLLDNALRYGARRATVSVPTPGTVRVLDDGPGVTPQRRRALQDVLDQQSYEGQTGLGLLLADLVARSHGGSLVLQEVEAGFAVELRLGPRA